MLITAPPVTEISLNDKPMKIFVTGGTGFIGSHLLKKLAVIDYEVVAHRRPNSLPRIDICKEPSWLEKPLDKIQAEDLKGVEVLIHLASVGVSPVQATWEDLFYWNVSVFIRLMTQAKRAGVTKIIVTGTFAEYGLSANQYDLIPPDAPLLPTYPYAASKAAAFVAAHAFAIENGLALSYLRIFSAYGEGQFEENFWPALKKAAISGADFRMTLGEQIRDYVAVEQVADEILKKITLQHTGVGKIQIQNIGTGYSITMREFAEFWWRNWNAKGNLLVGALPYRDNEVMRFVPYINRDK